MKLAAKTLILSALMMSNMAFAQVIIGDKQFPDAGKTYAPGEGGFGQYQTKSLMGTKKVVLTFDDGPDTVQTPRLLAILKKYNVKATFFTLAEKYNDKTIPLIKQVIAEGHIVASHHLDHEDNNGKTEELYKEQLKTAISGLAKIMEETGTPNTEMYYRFPYGAYGSSKLNYNHMNDIKEISEELYGDNCINFTFWDIDSLDWLKPMDNGDVISNIMANLVGGTAYNMVKSKWSGKSKKEKYEIKHPMGGGVILMHDIHSRTVDLMETLLRNFKEKGIQVVPLNEVQEYSYKGKECRLL
ncbi:MAG: polysaccharide deacetylase family protein [Bacteriovorax sp.]|nr:polysaccharide deacetylase family protein [Bacteriovorax sp.]